MRRLHIHALGINTGGGLVLLRQLLQTNRRELGFLSLDQRTKDEFSSYPNAKFFKHGVKSELTSQLSLRQSVRSEDHVLFFSNRPPLISFPCEVSVFNQNALLLNKVSWKNLRSKVNQLWLKCFAKNADQFIVQNSVMRRDLTAFLGEDSKIKEAPFSEKYQPTYCQLPRTEGFIYISSYVPHKNHENLIKAWGYLQQKNIPAELTLVTSGNNSDDLKKRVEKSSASSLIKVVANLSREDIYKALMSHKVLVYPSLTESFGLPLLEAKSCGLDIIAAELDYVRDVVSPVQSFDPHSHLSIARSVMRYMGYARERTHVLSPDQFMGLLLENKKEVLQKAS